MGPRVDADAVICAARAGDTAALIQPLGRRTGEPAAADRLYLGGDRQPCLPGVGFSADSRSSFGFVVPAIEGRRIIAGSFSSLKFAGRAPHGCVLMRVFLGGALQKRNDGAGRRRDGAAARAEISALLGVSAAPILTRVARWVDSMPQYAVGHMELVAEIEAARQQLAGLQLAGAAYHGVGIPDCVHNGEQAAEAAWSYLAIDRAPERGLIVTTHEFQRPH